MGALMARKDLLKGLIGDAHVNDQKAGDTPPAPSASAKDPQRSRYQKGAIGAVSQSIAELKSRSLIEVDASQIDPGGLVDRLGEDSNDREALIASIRDYGQQVPVLLRRDPTRTDLYQIVYGRRRVEALRALGQPVKAMVRDLSDHDLVVAQGQENSARRDLTFIEKANFARQMRDNGFERKIICDALHIDKTVISRMLSVADALPLSLITAIGSAPSAGRDRWRLLADRFTAQAKGPKPLEKALVDQPGLTSDQRFEAVLTALANKAPKPAPREIVLEDGADHPIARAKKSGRKTTLTFDARESDGFEDWLIENLNQIHRDWSKTREE
jgi:ParB family chromosome partitioning protein